MTEGPLRVLVTGGTGRLGREVAQRAREAGHTVRIQSRAPRRGDADPAFEWAVSDFATGEGIGDAVAGVDVVVHAASDSKRAKEVDLVGTGRLSEAARAAGVRHLIYVSIVGIDLIPLPYYAAKLAAESFVRTSGVPFSILRITQFHDYVDWQLRRWARFPLVMPLPSFVSFQSVDVGEAAARLVRAVADGPRDRLPDFGGPEPLTMRAAARPWCAARGVRKPILSFPAPGKLAAAFRNGHNLVPNGEHGTRRWQDWVTGG